MKLSLSVEQQAAVTDRGRPLMIVAGAGTGKTTVLTARIVHLIESGQARAEEILALTFTDKAAREMSDRLDEAAPERATGVEVGTFHALCDRLLRRHALEAGLDANFTVLSSAQAKLLLRESLFKLPLDRYRPRQDPLSYLNALARHFDKAKNEGVRVEEYLGWVDRLGEELGPEADLAERDRYERQMELAQSYRVYQELLSARGCLDFGDLLLNTLELFSKSPHLLGFLRQRYRYLLVDEFQDTNRTQFELVRQLAGDGARLTVVGDDDQAIYSFRGACVSNVLRFFEVFPRAHQAVLRQSYRSLQPILDAAYRSILQNNPRRLEVRLGLDKRLLSARTDLVALGEQAVELKAFAAVTDEAEAVAERVEELMGRSDVEVSDIALLVRNNRDANVYLRALEARGIPYRFQGSHGLYDRPEVRLLLDVAKLAVDPDDSLSCHHLAASPLFALSTLTLLQLNAYARRKSLSLHQAMAAHLQRRPDGGVELSSAELEKIGQFLLCLAEMSELVLELSPRALLHTFMTRSGWMARLAPQSHPSEVAQARNLARFFDLARAHESVFPQHRLPQFVEHLELLRQNGDSPPTVESDHHAAAVSIMTIHGSKGLEFSAVFLLGLTARRFPSWRREDPLEFPVELMTTPPDDPEQAHVDEERRLFYVAMTQTGYLSAEHGEHGLAKGLEAIEEFWRREQAEPAPRFVEREFRAHLGDNNYLLGVWDRVDELNGQWRLTDYKTSLLKSQDEADQRAQDSRQLVLYAMALESTVGVAPYQARLDFLGSGLVGAAVPTKRDFSRLQGEVRRAALGIRSRDYGPVPGYRTCQSCSFRSHCDSSAVAP